MHQDWWQTLIVEFHDLIEYDALWIDMNEPANFANGGLDGSGCEANNINYPPYKVRCDYSLVEASFNLKLDWHWPFPTLNTLKYKSHRTL